MSRKCKRRAPQCSCDSSVSQAKSLAWSFFEGFGLQRRPRPSSTSSFSCREVSSYLGTRSRDRFDSAILSEPRHGAATTVRDLPLQLT